MLDGLEECETVAFSTKGSIKIAEQKDLLIAAIVKTVDILNLKSIIVYSVSTNNDVIQNLFSYAIKKGVKIIIPNNLLKIRNVERSEQSYGKI